MQTHSLLFRLFANVFFSILIGMSWAFLASYCLKETQKTLPGSGAVRFGSLNLQHSHSNGTLAIDNIDILMMVLSPLVSYLMAETFSISGLLAIMVCGFL